MRNPSQARFSAQSSSLCSWSWILVLQVILCLMPTGVRGAIDVNETGLHDREAVYGIVAPTTPIPFVNSEDISMWAWGQTNPSLYADVSFSAFGISTDVNTVNTGDLTITGTGGVADAYAPDAFVDAYGIYSGYGLVDNRGPIDVTATGGSIASVSVSISDNSDAFARTYGIHSEDGAIDNSGLVTVTAAGGSVTSSILNTPHALFASAEARGLSLSSEATYTYPDRQVNNSGTITATATGGTAAGSVDQANASAWAYGIDSDEAFNDNSGQITAIAIGGNAESTSSFNDPGAYAPARAYGIHSLRGEVDNSGTIVAQATGGTASGTNGAVAFAYGAAHGVYAEGDVVDEEKAVVHNSGAVTAMATGGSAESASGVNAVAIAYGLQAAYADVTNSGAITATASAADGFASAAYGIYLDNVNSLTNTGIIRASGDMPYEVLVASGTTTLVDTYNVTLDGDPSHASLGVADGATLELNDATLTATAADGEFLWDTEYRLFETEGTGAVTGSFADVQAVNTNTSVIYDDQATVDSADDTVALAYAPTASAASASARMEKQAVSQALDVVNTHMTSALLEDVLSPPSSPLLADAGSIVPTGLGQGPFGSDAGVFVEPYYSRIDKDADPLGYDARLWGFSGGYERHIENSLVGLHLSYGQSDIDYTGAGHASNSEDQDVLTGGFTGLTRWEEWTLRYSASAFYGWHDYTGLTGLSLDEREEASYDSYGAVASVMGGHILRYGDQVFLPEVGLNYLWSHRKRYTTEATDPTWNTTYSAMSEHDVQAEATLRWLTGFMHGDVHVVPSLAVGVRHLLTDTESSVWQSVPGASPVLVTSERDRTALTLSASVVLTKKGRALMLAYDGEYSDDVCRDNFWLRYSWPF